MSSKFISIILFLKLIVPILAQDLRVVDARTLCFERSLDMPEIFVSGNEGPVPVSMPVESFSARFKCIIEANKAVFFRQDVDPASGKPVKIPVAVANVPAGTSDVLFYFIPSAKGSESLYDIRVVPDSFSKFPLGHTCILNINNGSVRFYLGEHSNIVLDAGRSALIPPVLRKDGFNMAPIKCDFMTVNRTWRTVSESKMRFTDQRRTLIISYLDPNNARPRLKIYKDFPPGGEQES